MDGKSYWNKRGRNTFSYKGEAFYTITPIPFYYKRRRILLNALIKEIEDTNVYMFGKTMHIHDFGCGDGWYLNYLYNRYPDFTYSGFDISEAFIERARYVLPKNIKLSCGDIDVDFNVNIIYSVAVFAHIPNKEIPSILNTIRQMLTEGGKFIIFEQTSGKKKSIQGKSYIRRLASEYEQMAIEAGFVLKNKFAVEFTVHRLFEHYLAKKLYRLFKGDTQIEQRINANNNFFFKFLSNLACILSLNPVKKKYKNYWGNTFFVFEKK
jgi:SAM-dependent methyltransferase